MIHSKGLLCILLLNSLSDIAIGSPRHKTPNRYADKYDIDISLDDTPDSDSSYYRDSNEVHANRYEDEEMRYAERELDDALRHKYHEERSNDVEDFYDDKYDDIEREIDYNRRMKEERKFEEGRDEKMHEKEQVELNDYVIPSGALRNFQSPRRLSKTKVYTIPVWPKTFHIKFNIRPTGINRYSYTNILHLSCDGKDRESYGSRIPGVWFLRGTTRLHIASAINGDKNKYYDTRALPLNKDTEVVIDQKLNSKNQYLFTIYLNQQKVYEIVNNDARVFRNVQVFVSEPFRPAAPAIISGLTISSPSSSPTTPVKNVVPAGSVRSFRAPRPVTRNTRLFTIPVWPKTFNVKFYIRPTGIVQNSYSNIMHFTHDGKDWASYGSRIPAVWFLPGTTRLHIASAINGKINQYYDTKALPLNTNTEVIINQAFKSTNQYVFTIHLDQQKVYEIVNNDAREFRNVQVFVSDPFRPAALATIFGFTISSTGSPGLPFNPGNTFAPCLRARPTIRCPTSQRTTPFRTIDGTCNNLDNPMWGASNTELRRLVDADYVDGFTIPRGFPGTNPKVPTADEVSRQIFRVEKQNVGNENGLAVAFMTFGQFLDHDLTEVRMDPSCRIMQAGSCADIQATFQYPCFPILRSSSSTKCTRFPRSEARCPPSGKETTTIRQQPNELTAFVDASQVYSPNVTLARLLRTLKGGEMKVTSDNLLPISNIPFGFGACSFHENVNGERPGGTGCRTLGGCSLVGDTRGDENIALHAMHTLWLREHNRIARQLVALNPKMADNDELIYQTARKIVGAEWAHITYEEYLPQLVKIKPYKGYNSKVDPTIFNSFAAAAFRYGHSLVPNFFELNNNNFDPINNSPILLQDAFFNREIINFLGIESTMFGLTGNRSNEVDNSFAESIARKLFVRPDETFESDLLALNIQRGRDHGLPTYGAYRKLCGLKTISTWYQLKEVMLPSAVDGFQRIYNAPGDIDLFAAGISEKHLPGLELGETFACLIGRQFEAVRDGDRFFYLNDNVFTSAQLNSIKQVSFASILCDNLKGIVAIQPKALLVPSYTNDRVPCGDIKRLDLNPWRNAAPYKDESMESIFK